MTFSYLPDSAQHARVSTEISEKTFNSSFDNKNILVMIIIILVSAI